jgi:DNA-directed RNA polymerase specialized sigma24 family protein
LGYPATGPARVGELTTKLSLSAFVEAESPGLVRGMRALTRELAEAEELAQEAMATAYERCLSFRRHLIFLVVMWLVLVALGI